MSLPGQMYDHMLNASKGWPSQTALDYTAKISANVLYDLRAGQICSLNSAGELEPGCRRWSMALFLLQGANDLDVVATTGDWYPISPGGNVACLVATGGFELWTTEFDSTQTYVPGEPLRSPVGNSSGAELTSGILTNQSVLAISATIASSGDKYTNICGIVSKGKFTNAYGKSCLGFWPVYYPGHPTES